MINTQRINSNVLSISSFFFSFQLFASVFERGQPEKSKTENLSSISSQILDDILSFEECFAQECPY